MKSRRSLTVMAAAAAVALASLAGAASAASAPAAETDPVKQALTAAQAKMTAPTRINQNIPLKVRPPKNKLVIFLNNGNAATQLIYQGVQQAAAAVGWREQSVSYNSANPATLQQAMMSALQQKPAGVIIAGEDPSKWGTAVTTAYAEARVPIIAGSTCPVPQIGSVFPGGSTCANNGPIGKALADWFIADSKGEGHILLQSMPIYNVYVVYRDAFQAEVKRLCPKCKVTVVETTLSQFAGGQIPSALTQVLRANPDIKYLFFDNAAWSRGILPALDAAGLLGKVKVGGQAIDDNGLQELKNGRNVVWSANAFPVYGMASMDSLFRVLTKSSGLTKNSAIPFQLVTSVNASTVTLPYTAPRAALQQYKKLWRIG